MVVVGLAVGVPVSVADGVVGLAVGVPVSVADGGDGVPVPVSVADGVGVGCSTLAAWAADATVRLAIIASAAGPMRLSAHIVCPPNLGRTGAFVACIPERPPDIRGKSG
jgi:hypothetical protein